MAEKFRSMQHTDVTDMNKIEHQSKMHIKNQIDMFNATITRKAVMRYLTIVVDFSSACLKQDLRPNRAIVMKDKISVSPSLSLYCTHLPSFRVL
jgi:hypothetical protein